MDSNDNTILKRIALLEQALLSEPVSPGNLLDRMARKTLRIIYAVGRDVIGGNLTLHAMSLVYTTMLSVVPMLALSFSVLKSLGVHNRLTPLLHNFFEPMGEKGLAIADNVLQFVDNIKVGVLGSVGLVLLIYTVISLVQKIERSFNYIWRVPNMRSLAQRFSNYLSVILIGPVLVVSAIGTTATIMSSSLMQRLIAIEPFGTLVASLTKMTPLLLITGAFVFVFTFIPNTRVNLKSALVGGVVGGIGWQVSGILFASFVVQSTQYEAIYSSFAVSIVMLIWLYVSWLVLLIGASITYYHQNAAYITRTYKAAESSDLVEKLGLAIMLQVARPFDEGKTPLSQLALETRMRVPATITRKVTDKMIRHGLLAMAGEKSDLLVPGKSLDQIRLVDVLKVLRLDEEYLCGRIQSDEALADLFLALDQAVDHVWQNRTVLDVVRRA